MHEPVIDAHCHLFDPARYPYRADTPYRPAGQEIATLEQMRAVFAAHNVQRALLVQPNSGYDTDLSCMLDAIAASDGAFKGVASVPPDISEAALRDLKARGIVGIAFNAAFHGVPYYTAQTGLLDKLTALGLFLQVQSEKDQLLGLLPMLRAFPGTLVIDHCGRPEMEAGLDAPTFQAVLALGREKRAWIKLSGYAKFSREPWPHRDVWPYLDAIKAAFGADRCLWASDWPFLRAAVRVDYGPLLTLAEMLFPSAADRSRFLWHNAARLCGFVTLPA
jgi:predicted TIM-barrel fold metal-dependent hydrolase